MSNLVQELLSIKSPYNNFIELPELIQGYTEEEIKELVNNTTPIGETVDKRRPNKTSDGKGRNDPASVYGTKTGGHVIINDVTGEVTQISDKNDKHWIPDSRIKWK